MDAVVEIWIEYLTPFLQWNGRIVQWRNLQEMHDIGIFVPMFASKLGLRRSSLTVFPTVGESTLDKR